MKNLKNKAFTLIEVLLSITIIATILTIGFYALTFISIGKIRLIESTKIQKEAFYFSEKLFEMIKKGGVIDYEEYFNRSIVGNTNYSSGHYTRNTGFGNFGLGGSVETTTYGTNNYYCLSPSGTSMGTGGCVGANNTPSANYLNSSQRYGQYAMQFIDYNSDYDGDSGDEDGDGNFIGDDDDEYIGQGPSVFAEDSDIKELYLISGDRKKRTLLRWTVKIDPDRPNSNPCDFTTDPTNPTGDGCLGTIEFLVLDGKDWGNDHSTAIVDANGTQYDGIVDTWIVNEEFTGNSTTIAASDSTYYWEKLFPDTISVSGFAIFAYPNKDIDHAWKDSNATINQSPYIRLKFSLSPSWKKRKIISGKIPKVDIATTISLNDEFSK